MGPTVTALGAASLVSATFTRPADTTTYAAGDVVSTTGGAIMEFVGAARDGVGAIQSAILLDSANVSTHLDAELWLFSSAPAVTADNAAIAFTDAELANLVGVVNFGLSSWKVGLATSGVGGNAVNCQTGIGLPFSKIIGSAPTNSLYGVLVARNAYVPVSAEIFTVMLTVLY